MMLPKLLPLLLCLLLLCSCGPEPKYKEEHAQQQESPEPEAKVPLEREDTIRFEKAFTQFFAALQAADTAAIQAYIHPNYGLWIIEQPGALPKMTQVVDITDFRREYQNRSFFTVREEVKACDLKEEVWPTFDCADMNYEAGKSGYSKEGCFVWQPDKFQKSGYWDYASLQPEQLQRIKTTLPLLQKSVLHTATSFEFHFGYVEGHWRLLFAKLIYPCSA